MNGMGIQISIVLTRVKRTIFLSNKKERGGLRKFEGNNLFGLEVFINENLASLLFLRIKDTLAILETNDDLRSMV